MAKNTEKNAQECNKKARAKYSKEKLRQFKFVLNSEQTEKLMSICTTNDITISALAKKLILEFMQEN